MNFVIDTNVIISAFLKEDSVPNDVLSFAFNVDNFFYYTKDIYNEYLDVVHRKKFCFEEDKINTFLALLKDGGVLVSDVDYHYNGKMIDNDDRMFYELAKSYDCFLITGNKKHYPNDSIVMSPKEFLDRLNLSA